MISELVYLYLPVYAAVMRDELSVSQRATIVAAALCITVGIKLWDGLYRINYLPGYRVPFNPHTALGGMSPTTWWNPGLTFCWDWKRNLYKDFKFETISVVPFIWGPPLIYTCNLEVARQIVGGDKTGWMKAPYSSTTFSVFGMNAFLADGDTWKRQRRVLSPAFTKKLFASVWNRTASLYKEMIEAEGWKNQAQAEIRNTQEKTSGFTLLVLAACAFGTPFSWATGPTLADGSMSVVEALRTLGESVMAISYLPNFILRLPLHEFKRIRAAQTTMDSYMHEQVASRKQEIRTLLATGRGEEVKRDAFSLLTKASEQEEGKARLSDEELVGNIFALLLAGHESTAHTLAHALYLLSLHPDIQEEVTGHIMEVLGPDKVPEYENSEQLDKVLAVFYEAVRMFPVGHAMIRYPTSDTVLVAPRAPGEHGTVDIVVRKDQIVVIDMIGIDYNPRYHPDPFEFKPTRWYGKTQADELRDEMTAFSFGPRACIGRKFAVAEGVCFLTLFMRDFRVEPLLESGETTEQWKAKVLKMEAVFTLNMSKLPLKFVRR